MSRWDNDETACNCTFDEFQFLLITKHFQSRAITLMRQISKMSTLLFAMQLREKVWSMSIAQWNRFHFTDYFTLLRTLLSGSINEVDISTPKAFILPLIYILLYKQVLEQAFLDLEKTQWLKDSKLWKQLKTIEYGKSHK